MENIEIIIDESIPLSTIPTVSTVSEIVPKNMSYWYPQSPFIWDGTYLGKLTDDNIEIISCSGAVGDLTDISYWKVTCYGYTTYCMVKASPTCFPSITDELKVIFRLPKLGTHRIHYKNKHYILIKPALKSNGMPEPETTLADLNKSTKLSIIDQIRETFVFRDILGITKTNESSLVVRHIEYPFHVLEVISFIEPKWDYCDTVLSNKLLEEWFNDVSPSDVSRKIFHIISRKDIPYRINMLRTHFESVVLRVDKDSVWIIDAILERLLNRLMNNCPE